ncbi:hypothetical protein [Endozoicomonas sp.]|uniref:hypothetical protein n=1 Tax=Endozoicomonas sp. TaxID=1892382 RepID=UPI002885F10C|nr:hypothetical protein [Endozoicomonas sp.]
MDSMNRTGGVQPQQASHEVQTDIAAEHKGVLNGITVEVKLIKEGEINGITVDHITKDIPIKTRIVKLAKTAVKKIKSLKNSRVKKSVEHKIAGQAKRAIKQQNWSQISPEREKELLSKVKHEGAREKLADRIDSFNQKINLLQQLKVNMKTLKSNSFEFETIYESTMNAAEKSLKGKSLPKGLVVVMPPAEGGKELQYVQVTAKDNASRREAVQELGTIFRESNGFKGLLRDRQTLTQYKSEREGLKKEIKALEKDMKALYKGYKNDWVKEDKETVKSKAASDLMERGTQLSKDQEENVAVIESRVVESTSELDGLRERSSSMAKGIVELKEQVQIATTRLQRLDKSLSKVEVDRELVVDEVKPVFNETQLAAKKVEAEDIRVGIAVKKKDLVALKGSLKVAQSIIARKTKELQKLDGEKQRFVTQHANEKKALEKEIDGQIKKETKVAHEDGETRYKEFSAFVSGEADQRKTYESSSEESGSKVIVSTTEEELSPLLESDELPITVESEQDALDKHEGHVLVSGTSKNGVKVKLRRAVMEAVSAFKKLNHEKNTQKTASEKAPFDEALDKVEMAVEAIPEASKEEVDEAMTEWDLSLNKLGKVGQTKKSRTQLQRITDKIKAIEMPKARSRPKARKKVDDSKIELSPQQMSEFEKLKQEQPLIDLSSDADVRVDQTKKSKKKRVGAALNRLNPVKSAEPKDTSEKAGLNDNLFEDLVDKTKQDIQRKNEARDEDEELLGSNGEDLTIPAEQKPVKNIIRRRANAFRKKLKKD